MYTTESTARPTCEHPLGRQLVTTPGGFPAYPVRYCATAIGVTTYVGTDEEEHTHCAAHRDAVRRAAPPAPRCGCPAVRHGPGGCADPGRICRESGDPLPCRECDPWSVIGVHASEASAIVGRAPRYTPAELAEANADLELVADETGGRGFVA